MAQIRIRGLTPYFLYLLFVSTLGPLLFGFHLAELNAPEEVLTCKKKSLLGPDAVPSTLPRCIPMTLAQLGLVSSIFTLGGLIGALGAAPVSATRGRLYTMKLTAVFFVLGPFFEAIAPSITIISIGRFISGIGAGASIVVVPIYVSEIAPPAQRGFFGSSTQVMVNVGIFTTQLLGYLFSYGQMWRLVLGAGGAIGLALGIGLFGASESPKWLATTGKIKQGSEVLQRIRGHGYDIEEEVKNWTLGDTPDMNPEEEQGLLSSEDPNSQSMANSLHKEDHKHVGLVQVFQDPNHRKAVFVVIMVMVAQQLTGINSIVMYGVALLVDLLQSNSALLNLLVSAVNICVTIACAPLVDRLGRKTCLVWSITGMGVSSLLLGFAIKVSIPVLSALSVLLFVSSFAFGLGPVPFILASELVGPEAVNAVQSLALGSNWISTFIVAQFFPVVNKMLGAGIVYFVFAAIAAFFATFVSLVVPESKGKKDADEVWGRTNERQD